MSDTCVATYRLYDDRADFHKKAESIAVGLTVGSWTDIPETKKASMQKHLGRVVDVHIHESDVPNERYADVRIAYPDVNFSRDIPALLVTVFGKLSMDGRVKLLDLDWSSTFQQAFSGPKFGIAGIREQLGVHNRPLLMSIFKSVIGHDLSALREQFYQQALGGVDLIKDDEILFENPLTPIQDRVNVCLEAAKQVEEETGKKLLYAANLTGPTFELRDQARRAIDAGANALLFNVLSYGYDALHGLASDPDISVPIMAHPAMAGALYPSPHYGISARLLLGKLLRLAGADFVLFPSPYGSVTMPLEDTQGIREACLDTARPMKQSFPVPSAGIHPGLVPLIIRDYGIDVVVNAGGGVHGHPLGAAGGGQAFVQAIDAVLQGISLNDYAQHHEALHHAIQIWGTKE
ncbi:2,3-diketo-5-methylthiopentyl-1-phosphate enolase [Paenibacillus arenosi]|uniref:2,3-diketo-5-methylthiopentyl-1-phosphate enolase n=1 Tax=Paenibacillus arenosi TaxID=2774142 RepID=A0ABR9ATW4_9BACL|nr:2,3-diketo-5-methylthiopentyl-1-phosphate enolase [Paenibacillus arenosi]MBD8497567.1 2,3-diketo-5-methylthiopentyl-1-phosphate enolase [Paenibacillus arenosi]